jgi:hypothetical protein
VSVTTHESGGRGYGSGGGPGGCHVCTRVEERGRTDMGARSA